MGSKKNTGGRIFISYRRADARGVAGRLADTLEDYFGDNRVFRDIDDIAGGSDFAKVIDNNLESADAVIVLIGPDWTTINDGEGNTRLGGEGDYVTAEITSAIKMGVPIYPVLIEDTPMPRESELPEELAPLVRFNAVSISDRRWKYDVLRLGKVIAFDIPSANERLLDRVRAAISLAFCLSVTTTTGIVVWNVFFNNEVLLQPWHAGISFTAAALSTLGLMSIKDLIATDKRPYIMASIWTGTIGCLSFFVLLVLLASDTEPIVMYFGSTMVISIMFALMVMSGFKVK